MISLVAALFCAANAGLAAFFALMLLHDHATTSAIFYFVGAGIMVWCVALAFLRLFELRRASKSIIYRQHIAILILYRLTMTVMLLYLIPLVYLTLILFGAVKPDGLPFSAVSLLGRTLLVARRTNQTQLLFPLMSSGHVAVSLICFAAFFAMPRPRTEDEKHGIDEGTTRAGVGAGGGGYSAAGVTLGRGDTIPRPWMSHHGGGSLSGGGGGGGGSGGSINGSFDSFGRSGGAAVGASPSYGKAPLGYGSSRSRPGYGANEKESYTLYDPSKAGTPDEFVPLRNVNTANASLRGYSANDGSRNMVAGNLQQRIATPPAFARPAAPEPMYGNVGYYDNDQMQGYGYTSQQQPPPQPWASPAAGPVYGRGSPAPLSVNGYGYIDPMQQEQQQQLQDAAGVPQPAPGQDRTYSLMSADLYGSDSAPSNRYDGAPPAPPSETSSGMLTSPVEGTHRPPPRTRRPAADTQAAAAADSEALTSPTYKYDTFKTNASAFTLSAFNQLGDAATTTANAPPPARGASASPSTAAAAPAAPPTRSRTGASSLRNQVTASIDRPAGPGSQVSSASSSVVTANSGPPTTPASTHPAARVPVIQQVNVRRYQAQSHIFGGSSSGLDNLTADPDEMSELSTEDADAAHHARRNRDDDVDDYSRFVHSDASYTDSPSIPAMRTFRVPAASQPAVPALPASYGYHQTRRAQQQQDAVDPPPATGWM
ncbi:hypothetical protein RI367_005495 [Sorochytrium milnesiophthora]